MGHQREFAQVHHAQFGLAVDGLGHAAGHHQRLQRHAGQDVHRFLVCLAFAQENADLARPAAVNGYVKVSDTNHGAVFVGTLHAQQLGHFLGGLVEGGCLRIVMQASVRAQGAVHQADGHGHAQGIGVLQGHGAFQANDVVRRGNMVVGGLHGLFHHLDHRGIFAAEGHFGLVVGNQFIGRARAADGVHLTVDALLGQFGLPVGGVGNEGAVRQVDQALGYRQHRQGGIQVGEHLVQEPVHAERRNAANDEIGPFDGLFPLVELIILDPFREGNLEFGMLVGGAAGIDDVLIQRCAHQAHLIAVFESRERKGGAHHSGADDGNGLLHIFICYISG